MYAIPILLLILFAYPIAAKRWNEWQERKQRAMEIALVRLIQEPIKIASEHPADNTVYERAENIKRLLSMSGNTWVSAADVHAYVYHPLGNAGSVYMSFAVWEQQVNEDFARKKAEKIRKAGEEFKAPLYGQTINLNTN